MKRFLTGLALCTLMSLPALAKHQCEYDAVTGYTSSNEISTPAFLSVSSWQGYFFITNVSDQPVTVKMSLTNVNGGSLTPSTIVYDGNFSGANTPLNANGAVLQPGQLGEVFVDNPTRHINVGKVSWEADACLSEALMVSMQTNQSGGGNGTTLTPLNDGKAF